MKQEMLYSDFTTTKNDTYAPRRSESFTLRRKALKLMIQGFSTLYNCTRNLHGI